MCNGVWAAVTERRLKMKYFVAYQDQDSAIMPSEGYMETMEGYFGRCEAEINGTGAKAS